MIQEAVLETREGDRYIGFLIEEEEWQGVGYLNADLLEEEVKVHHAFKWRITDRLTGATTEGPIPSGGTEAQITQYFHETWLQFENSSYRPPVPEAPVIPVDPYASHPNYGRF
jgi:hypothetical protein